jgi:hypothetical protein
LLHLSITNCLQICKIRQCTLPLNIARKSWYSALLLHDKVCTLTQLAFFVSSKWFCLHPKFYSDYHWDFLEHFVRSRLTWWLMADSRVARVMLMDNAGAFYKILV